jgi:TPR repeat protein
MFGRSGKTEDLVGRVSRLQAALRQCSEVAGRWTEFRRGVTGAIAVLMLALGFTFGVYREPLQDAVVGLAQTLGFASESSDAAYAAYQEGHYATALRLARPLAAEGDARAQSTLGLLYYRGNGVPQDPDEALKWFRRAADQDDAIAQFHLGVMFSKGEGVPQDNAEAANWFRRAADLGDAPAQYNLGLFYAKGVAGEPDNVSAHMWFNLAAAHFPASDIDDRSAAVRNRDLVTKKMSPEEIVAAQKLARDWKPK